MNRRGWGAYRRAWWTEKAISERTAREKQARAGLWLIGIAFACAILAAIVEAIGKGG